MAGTNQVENGSDYESNLVTDLGSDMFGSFTSKVSRKSILVDRNIQTQQGEKRKRPQQTQPARNRAQGMYMYIPFILLNLNLLKE